MKDIAIKDWTTDFLLEFKNNLTYLYSSEKYWKLFVGRVVSLSKALPFHFLVKIPTMIWKLFLATFKRLGSLSSALVRIPPWARWTLPFLVGSPSSFNRSISFFSVVAMNQFPAPQNRVPIPFLVSSSAASLLSNPLWPGIQQNKRGLSVEVYPYQFEIQLVGTMCLNNHFIVKLKRYSSTWNNSPQCNCRPR